ncbi:vacuolar protein sorting-associated protein 52 homolog isoform X4 [Gadus morhua]|uniref:vacuolar protein sorting-associated protein 52 homolog isoform X4 n=1 Tax=Gadus morhua TaxID=8049 RepID=UPI0011B656DD|nr:vacuolar protein sorting-associated protein 52 homolog isoform X4 [Gadus morhua]
MADCVVADADAAVKMTEDALAYLPDEKLDGDMAPLQLGELDLTTDEFILDEVDIHIQANLEDDLVKEALRTGVDLRHYSKQVETELQRIEQASIKDYIKESQNIALLHNQITACDSILERMEGMLSGFQSDLSSISSEIQTLQQQSVSMNVRLKNRQAVRSHLSQLVDELVVPAAMISTVLDSPVTDQEFLEQLHELNNKINFTKELSFRETLACNDIQDIVDRLKIKAVSKIREFILQKIYSFRKPMTNYQIPQNTLLKYRFFYQFLLANERTVAKEIRDEYVDTMSKIYYSYFKSYSGRLLKVQYEEVADKDDLMGVEDTAKKGFFSKPSLKSRNTIFTLGQRGALLSPAELEGPILIPHTAQRGDSRYPYESLFRSQHYALLDNGCREFLFISDFFMVTGNSGLDLFNSIMGKTLSMLLKSMSSYVADCFDSIAVFLCIHILLRYRAITTKRGLPALDRYWCLVLVTVGACLQVLGGGAGAAVAALRVDPGDEHPQHQEHGPSETRTAGHQTPLHHPSLCRVLLCHCQHQPDLPQRTHTHPAGPAAGGGGELCAEDGGGVSLQERPAHLPHQQLRHDAQRPHGVHRGAAVSSLRGDDLLREGGGGADGERAAGAAEERRSSYQPAGAGVLQLLEALCGGHEPGGHEVVHQLQERHQHHPGRSDPADPVLPWLP